MLLKGDRLEPTFDFPDVHKVDKVSEPFVAFTLLFWRAKPEIVVHHRNPVLCRELGISYSAFSVDVLHCLHLGVFLVWITTALHLLISVDAFETRRSRKADHLVSSALAIKARLNDWYPRYERKLKQDGKTGCRVNFFSDKMLGTPDGKKLVKLKAAEARHFMPFALELVQEFAPALAAKCKVVSLIRAGECLQEYMAIINREPRKMSTAATIKLVELQCEHNVEAYKAGVRILPKHHQAQFILFGKIGSVVT